MNNTYILNRETGKIELHFEKSEYDALTDAQRSSLKSNYLWSKTAKAWVSRAKYPNLYHAKKVAAELGFTEEEKVGERLTYAEQLERKSERAEARAERYEGYAANAEKRGDALTGELEQYRGDTAFFTQPIIAGHAGSQSFARRREQIFARYDKGMAEYRKSAYFKERAQTAMETADNAQLQNPSYLDNRIKECNAAIRKLRKVLESYEKVLDAHQNPTEENANLRNRYSEEKVTEWQEDVLERLEIQVDKLGFFQNCLEEIGGLQFSKENIKPGYVVQIRKFGNYKILKANPTTIYAKSLSTGSVISFTYAEISKIVSDTEETQKQEREAHPYKKDDILVWDPHGSGRCIAAYQVTSVTAKTVQLREIELDKECKPLRNYFIVEAKVLRRKPFVNIHTNKWGVTGDYERVLHKYEEKEVSE